MSLTTIKDFKNLKHLYPDENLEQTRMNVKAGFIACINFVGSFQLHTPKQITFLLENTDRSSKTQE